MFGEKQKLSLYMHTHWDREWYWAFERYRTMLVTAMKLVVQALEDNEIPNFHLDGQVCALDDFLELEPSYEERIKKLNAKKKLSIGPWYVLADQMLVGGESLIRNLEIGMAHTRRYGNPMMVGYCPDTFGHSQDLPRILKGFGVDNAVVWRGVPALDKGPEFAWKSPDGSEVIAQFLAKGYHQTLFHEAEGSLDADRIDVIVESLLTWLGLKWDKDAGKIVENPDHSLVYSRQTSGCLVPVGGDHQKPPANLSNIIKKVEARIAELVKQSGSNGSAKIASIELNPVQLPEYLKVVSQAVLKPGVALRLIEGELRSNESSVIHGAAYMLPGVLSTRLYLKRANRILEHRLTRVCEPLYSLMTLSGLSEYPASEIDNCWRYMLKNHPHDSMCGCSVDDVHREMMTRFASVHHILDVLDQRARQDVLVPGVHEWSHGRSKRNVAEAKKTTNKTETKQATGKKLENAGFGRGFVSLADPDVPLTGIGVFNLSLDKISAPVKVSFAIPSSYFDHSCENDPGHSSGDSETKPVASRRFSEEEMQIAASRYLTEITGADSSFQIEFVKFETELFGESCGVPLYKDVNLVEGWLWGSNVAPLSLKTIDFENKVAVDDDIDYQKVASNGSMLSNGIFDVSVSGEGQITIGVKNADGLIDTYTLDHKVQDVADAGDSYNFDPIMDDHPIVAKFVSCSSGKSGPLIGSLLLTYRIELPVGLLEQPSDDHWKSLEGEADLVQFKRSSETIEHEIITRITLKRGEPILFFETKWVNHSADHRLEVLLNTGAPVKTTWSENHFSLVERTVSEHQSTLPVPKYTESPLDRFPCQRFFVANGQAFFNLGVPEYGVSGNSVSITLLRAISMLSRRRLLTRGGGAGPYMPVPEGNCIGENTVSYGWAPLMVAGLSAPLPVKKSVVTLDDSSRANAYRLAERFEGALWATPLTAKSMSQKSTFAINLDNPMIRFIAMYSNDRGKSILLRLLNVAMTSQESTLFLSDSKAKVEKVDLAGHKQSAVAPKNGEQLKVAFGPNELATLRITPAS